MLNWLADKPYLKLVYRCETGENLNLEKPKTFNEKLQWLKLYDRNSKYNIYADKYDVRAHIEETIGEQYLIPFIGLYDSVDEIDWDALPNQFVLKCTHGSSSNIICSDKNTLNIEDAKKKLRKWMEKSWYWFGREWVYKDIKPRIVCEKYMVDESGTELKDYKIFCFNGKAKLIQVDFNRYKDHKRNLYTTDWQYIDAKIKRPNDASKIIQRPEKLEDMLMLAEKLSANIPHARVDFYSINNSIYFGEITFFHGSGFEKFEPDSLGDQMGNWIRLPNIK
ncbi:ATP-grasp fold amidoligase family protein [Bacillus sp. FSL K6-3431]|uniref:ATP-grasp fold amidoligase family protein n=1 Tax=Bacillus sp. FSL K6-3431 TaxID=2921500 RepID=UPI0030F7078E